MSTSVARNSPAEEPAIAGAPIRPLAAAWTRWVDCTPTWLMLVFVLILLALPVILGLAEGLLKTALASGEIRFWLLWPTLSIYTLTMLPRFVRTDRRLVRSIRPLVQVDDAQFQRTLQSAARFTWHPEALAFLAGALSGMLIGDPREVFTAPSISTWYLYISAWTAFGLLGWIVLVGFTSARLTSALYSRPIAVDLFDLDPFDPVGRHSLLIVLTIVGGTLISLIFIFDPGVIGSWQNLVIYSLLTALTVVLFFANMWPTHRLLARTKRTHLRRVERRIGAVYARLDASRPNGAQPADAMVALSAEMRALIAAEQRLKLTRTWPYDTETLRALTISVLTPLAVGLSRLLAAWLAGGPAR